MIDIVWLAYEAYTAIAGRKLVTPYSREWSAASPMFPAGVGFVIGVLFGHFFWNQ